MASRGARAIPRELPKASTNCVQNHPHGGPIGNWHTHTHTHTHTCIPGSLHASPGPRADADATSPNHLTLTTLLHIKSLLRGNAKFLHLKLVSNLGPLLQMSLLCLMWVEGWGCWLRLGPQTSPPLE